MRPVLDFRRLNNNIVSLPGEMLACEAKLREWAPSRCSLLSNEPEVGIFEDFEAKG